MLFLQEVLSPEGRKYEHDKDAGEMLRVYLNDVSLGYLLI